MIFCENEMVSVLSESPVEREQGLGFGQCFRIDESDVCRNSAGVCHSAYV